MADPIIEAAQREYDQIVNDEKDLIAQAEHTDAMLTAKRQRKKELAEFFRLAKSVAPHVKLPDEQTQGVHAPVGESQTYKATITSNVETLLKHNRYLPIRQIIEGLQAFGVEVRGDTPEAKITRTSVLLNKDGRFKADRILGWSLKKRPSQNESTGQYVASH